MNLHEMKKNLMKLNNKKISTETQYGSLMEEIATKIEEKNEIETAYGIIKKASSYCLVNLKEWLETVVNKTLAILFPKEDFKVNLEFKEIRGQASCEIKMENGQSIYDIGGGALDVISLIIQIGLIKLQGENKLLIADEPLKHLSADKQEVIGKLIEDLCNELGVQVILVTHSPEFISNLHDSEVIKL